MKNLTANKRSVLILGIVLMVLLALAGWKFALSPALDAGNAQQTQLDQTNAEIAQNTIDINKQCQTIKGIQGILLEAAKNQAKFPPNADVSSLFNQVRRAANSAGIPTKNISSINAAAPTIGDAKTVAEMPVAMTVTSGYSQVTRFLAALEAMPRSFLVTNLAVTGGSTPTTVTITLSGNAFIIQTKSLQDILTEIYQDKDSIRTACRITQLPPLSTGSQASGPVGGDSGAITTPTKPPAANQGSTGGNTQNTTPAVPPSTQLPIVPAGTPATSGTALPS